MTDFPPSVLSASRIDSYQFLNKPEYEKLQGHTRAIILHFLENSSWYEPKIKPAMAGWRAKQNCYVWRALQC